MIEELVYGEIKLVEIDGFSGGKEEATLPSDHKKGSEFERYKPCKIFPESKRSAKNILSEEDTY